MKRLLLTIGLLLAADTAQAQGSRPVPLLGSHIVCSRVAVAAELMALRDNARTFNRRAKELHAQRLCAQLPKGTLVYLDDQDGMFSCLRPVDVGACGWTVLIPAQARQFR